MDSPRSLSGLSLRDLEYAVAVAELRHFGRAADRCGVSQPALSEQLRKLETLLGVTLFERSKRRVALTADGVALLAQARRVLEEARELVSLSQSRPGGLGGVLSLGAIETLGPYYLPGLLRLMREARPEIGLRLAEGRTARLIERLLGGELDLALLAMPAGRGGLASAPLFFEPFLLAAPPGHRLAGLPRLALDELPADDLLLLEEGHCLRDQALSLCEARPGVTRHATSLETLWQMIAAGEGYSLLPALAVAARPEMRDLVVCRSLADASAGREIALVWRAADPRDALFRDLAALLIRALPETVRAGPVTAGEHDATAPS
jgi:LysR family hydrogen peroxide-inducible transcriptional activator